jgi:uncharacterized HhH-GPD family protein
VTEDGGQAGFQGQDKFLGRQLLAAALLRYADTMNAAAVETSGVNAQFTKSAEANELLSRDPFAFLIAVICMHGVSAERAWMAPYLLSQRLQHLSPEKMAADEDGVRSAIETEPKLHRFVGKMSSWIVAAGRIVVAKYGGDAGIIWSGSPDAHVLQDRLEGFPGIGQKKAAMAVAILEREMGVPVNRMERSDIAYDVHVRRVFLRSHLADRDDQDHMIAAARKLHPAQPSALDYPTWVIGKTWCHPSKPDCGGCPISDVCPKDIRRAEFVFGA